MTRHRARSFDTFVGDGSRTNRITDEVSTELIRGIILGETAVELALLRGHSYGIHPSRLQEVFMSKQFLAGALVLALATGITTSAMASDQGGRSRAKMHTKRHAGARGINSAQFGVWDGRRFVGGGGGYPYGDGFDVRPGAGSPYCWPYDYSYPSGYPYCGASYIVSW